MFPNAKGDEMRKRERKRGEKQVRDVLLSFLVADDGLKGGGRILFCTSNAVREQRNDVSALDA